MNRDDKSKLVKAIRDVFNSREHHHDNMGLYLLRGRFINPKQYETMKKRISTYTFL